MTYGEPKRIVQISPNTTNTQAMYENEDDPNAPYQSMVVAWALVELEEGYTTVYGMDVTEDGGADFCETMGNFLGYTHK